MVELWTFTDGKHSKTCLWNSDTDTTFIAKNIHGGLLAEVMCTLRSQGGRQRDTAVCVKLFAMQGVGSHWRSGCFVTSPVWLKTWCEGCCSKSSWIIFWTFGWHHRGGICFSSVHLIMLHLWLPKVSIGWNSNSKINICSFHLCFLCFHYNIHCHCEFNSIFQIKKDTMLQRGSRTNTPW